jgi:hypothetical protein
MPIISIKTVLDIVEFFQNLIKCIKMVGDEIRKEGRLSMRWISVQKLGIEEFRRLTGVKKETFEKMMGILAIAHAEKKARGGRKTKLCLEDMLLMALEYLREYRTYFHISVNYGLSESNAYKIIRWVENTLIKSKAFSLPGRKALLKSDVEYSIILMDASETPIQRPKKTALLFFRQEKKAHTEKPSSGR